MKEYVQYFIGLFKDAEYIFTNGLCYWFAHILYYRFKEEYECEIYYNPVMNHYVTRVEDCLFDVRGIVSDDVSQYVPWEEYQKSAGDMHLLIPNCIKKLPYKDRYEIGEIPELYNSINETRIS